MRLELGTRVTCSGGELGGLIDVVVDPASKTLTHLVVDPYRGDSLARLVPR
jgi:sporulation protein YlmC with PRC-barrel domain